MIFNELGQTATITFDMGTLEAMARACRVASECGAGHYPYDMAASAFTAAAVIARVHGDIPTSVTERMAEVHKRITKEDASDV
jgi:hypothetical protein